MAHQHFDEHSVKKYTLTAFISFVVVFFFLMLMMQCHGDFKQGEAGAHEAVAEKHAPADEATAVTSEPAAAKPESIKVKLPDGTELEAYKGGIEDKLVAFLNDSTAKPGKDVWFDFDNVNFKTGSAEIADESKTQVSNIAAVLKAYPKTKIKIGGYTDKTGDSLTNLKLSGDRATAVLNALKGANANAAQLLGAEGYGSQFAKAAADAPDEERKKDRRISISVREK